MHIQRHSTTALLNMRHAATRMPVRIDTHFARPRSSCERVASPLAPLGAINLAGIPTAVYPSGTWLGLGLGFGLGFGFGFGLGLGSGSGLRLG